jgi:hypothetical protein
MGRFCWRYKASRSVIWYLYTLEEGDVEFSLSLHTESLLSTIHKELYTCHIRGVGEADASPQFSEWF